MGPAETLSPGTTIGGYRIDGVLGEGGMGVVYEATQLSLERKVALKVLAARLSDDDEFRRRFRREGRLQAAIDHPHIITVYEAGESEAGLFLAMRLVRGRTLKDLIAADALDAHHALSILRPIAGALDTAHAAGLIHRDVKPHNILVGAHDDAYLGDFGLTKSPDDPDLTRNGEFLGTPNYVSPEQVGGEQATAASDVYAFAAVLFECLTGVVPFPRTSNAAVLYAHVSAPPPAVTALRPDLPDAVDGVVARGMAKDPAERPATASVLVDEAQRALADAAGLSELAVTGAASTRLRSPGAIAAGAAVGSSPVDAARGMPADYTTLHAGKTATTTSLPRQDAGTLHGPLSEPGPGPATAWRRRLAPLGVVLALAAPAAAGLLLSRGQPQEPPAARRIAAAGLQLSVPATWREAAPSGAIGVAGLAGVVATAPALPEGAGLVVGRADVSGSPLLPSSLRRSVTRVPAPDAVRLAGGEAYRYPAMRVRESPLRVTAYVLPTTQGAGVVACHGPAGARAFAAACERIAGTLRSTTGKLVPLGPSESYARRLSRTMRILDGRRRIARRRLRAASSVQAQARQADGLSAAFRGVADRLRRVQAPASGEDAHERVRGGAARAARAYGRLRRAAEAGDRSRYDHVRRDVRRAESRFRDSLRALRGLGYRTA